MSTPNPRLEPFVGYRVTLAPDAGASSLPRLAPLHPAVRALLDGQRIATLSLREADALYDTAESVSGGLVPSPFHASALQARTGAAIRDRGTGRRGDPAPGPRWILWLGALPRGSNRRRPGLRRSTDANACLAASAAPHPTGNRRGSG
jgi:hypothetical protein